MNNVKNLLGVWPILLILSSCEHGKYLPPIIEICINGDAGGICYDPRKPEGERDYILSDFEMLNYISTNPKDWAQQQKWWLSILKKLNKCERGLNVARDKVKRTGVDHFK